MVALPAYAIKGRKLALFGTSLHVADYEWPRYLCQKVVNFSGL